MELGRDEMRRLYGVAGAARIGSAIQCPGCGRRHVKTTYNKVFCSNQRTRRAGNCKDRYWNLTDDARLARAAEVAVEPGERRAAPPSRPVAGGARGSAVERGLLRKEWLASGWVGIISQDGSE